MPRNLTLSDAQAAGYITRIRGNDSNIGMAIDVQNDSDEAITITSEAGTVIGSKDPNTQKMVITRGSSWTVSPRSTESLAVDALCMEARKAPPRSDARDTDHSIGGMTDFADVRKLLKTVGQVESEFSTIASLNEAEREIYKPRLNLERLTELVHAMHPEAKSPGETVFRIYNSLVQLPLWQLTDRLELTDYAKIIGKDRSASLEELRATVEALTYQAKMSQTLLREAELAAKQTVRPPENELEVLGVEYELLSSDITRLKHATLVPATNTESVRSELSQKSVMLEQRERAIRIHSYKETLIDQVSLLSVTNTYTGRTALLSGIQADNLNRSETSKQLDLDLIFDQLARHERDEHGQNLLLIFLDNARNYAKGFEAHPHLTDLRGKLESL
jgi:hypothetical protein